MWRVQCQKLTLGFNSQQPGPGRPLRSPAGPAVLQHQLIWSTDTAGSSAAPSTGCPAAFACIAPLSIHPSLLSGTRWLASCITAAMLFSKVQKSTRIGVLNCQIGNRIMSVVQISYCVCIRSGFMSAACWQELELTSCLSLLMVSSGGWHTVTWICIWYMSTVTDHICWMN
jgi:hypothetical protein